MYSDYFILTDNCRPLNESVVLYNANKEQGLLYRFVCVNQQLILQ